METKPGYKTTEFWLSLAAMLLSALYASGALVIEGVPDWVLMAVGVVATVLTALGYTVNRTLAKGHSAKLGAAKAHAAAAAKGAASGNSVGPA